MELPVGLLVEWDNVRSVCIYKKQVKIKYYRELQGDEK